MGDDHTEADAEISGGAETKESVEEEDEFDFGDNGRASMDAHAGSVGDGDHGAAMAVDAGEALGVERSSDYDEADDAAAGDTLRDSQVPLPNDVTDGERPEEDTTGFQ